MQQVEGATVAQPTAPEPAEKPLLNVEFLHVVHETQQARGLKYGDYTAYRAYLTRRLRTIRHATPVLLHGKKKFQKRAIQPEMIGESRELHYLLWQAERAYSYAMALRLESEDHPRRRHHSLSRLRKAAAYSKQLVELCEKLSVTNSEEESVKQVEPETATVAEGETSATGDDDTGDAGEAGPSTTTTAATVTFEEEKKPEVRVSVSERTVAEAIAYSAWMQGTMAFDHDRFKEALEHFQRAKALLDTLAGSAGVRDAYDARLSDIEPSIKFCAHKLSRKGDVKELLEMRQKAASSQVLEMLSTKLESVFREAHAREAQSLTSVTHIGREIPIRSAQTRMALVKVNELRGEVVAHEGSETTAATTAVVVTAQATERDNLIAAVVELLQTVKEERRSLDSSTGVADKGKALGLLNELVSYATCMRYTETMNRDVHLAESLASAWTALKAAQKAQRTGKKDGNGGEATAAHATETPDGSVRPEALVKLYDTLMQCAHSLRLELESLSLSADRVDTRHLVGAQIALAAAKEATFKAFRCLYVAEVFADTQKFTEAFSLFDRTATYAAEAIAACDDCGDPALIARERTALVTVANGARSSKIGCEIEAAMAGVSSAVSVADGPSRALAEALDDYPPNLNLNDSSLIAFPPAFVPVNAKPLLFDLALNHVELPSVEHRVEKTGILGNVLSFWGGWGKK